MRKILKIFIILLCTTTVSCAKTSHSLKVNLKKKYTSKDLEILRSRLRTGDLIFQYTNSRVAKITKSLTSSPITHVGIVIANKDKIHVLEASRKVKFTELRTFLLKSKNGWLAIKRPIKELSYQQTQLINKELHNWLNKPYDFKFSWSNEKIYCTELVYKIYEAVGIKISGLQLISEIIEENKNNPVLKSYIEKVYRKKENIKQNQPILTPALLFHSEKLVYLKDEEGNWYNTFPYHINDSGP